MNLNMLVDCKTYSILVNDTIMEKIEASRIKMISEIAQETQRQIDILAAKYSTTDKIINSLSYIAFLWIGLIFGFSILLDTTKYIKCNKIKKSSISPILTKSKKELNEIAKKREDERLKDSNKRFLDYERNLYKVMIEQRNN